VKVLKIFFIILFLLILAGFALFYTQFSAPQKKFEEERFVVNLKSSEEQIVDNLKEKGFIKNKNAFNFILTIKGWHGKISEGAFLISKDMNVFQLAKKLIAGPYQKWVVILPGKRKEQVAVILQKALSWPFSLARSFINLAEEGYLYPDTYLIDTDADPRQIIQKLRFNFNEKFDADLQKELLKQNIRNDTALKIASLIERESGGVEDKPIIAGIIWNRLLKEMKLEIDATVQYAIATEKFNSLIANDQLLITDDFSFWPTLSAGIVRTIDSPYNTYLIKALPAGPICSPSIDSIRAVAFPAQTDAFYYLHSSDKKIHTAKTYKEHQENIVKYLQ